LRFRLNLDVTKAALGADIALRHSRSAARDTVSILSMSTSVSASAWHNALSFLARPWPARDCSGNVRATRVQ
jgi:hypothetical protein